MDQEEDLQVNGAARPESPAARVSRRTALKYGLSGVACAACAGGGVYYFRHRLPAAVASTGVFKGDAPSEDLWRLWQARGWVAEARHFSAMGQNVQCGLCPNECVLEPGDRGRCRDRVFRDGKLYSMAYGNPCAIHVDPIEKKPLFHFLPGTGAFSIATAGCGFRCLNCQNWDISQRKPEQTKDPRGPSVRLTPERLTLLTREDIDRMSVFPDDVAALAEYCACASIAYTYSEPTVWYEYMFDTAKAARARNLKNVWVTCGYIQQKPLVELCRYLDGAHVDLKSFDDAMYRRLNSGKLQPILDTMTTLKREGVWFEVINLIVPTYTDQPGMIRRMCDWLVSNLGPDYPLHFSRFHAAHRLTNLPPTPPDILEEARTIARQAGLHYVYVGNLPQIEDAETTFCPGCKKAVIRRNVFSVESIDLTDGKCNHCGTAIAGVWKA